MNRLDFTRTPLEISGHLLLTLLHSRVFIEHITCIAANIASVTHAFVFSGMFSYVDAFMNEVGNVSILAQVGHPK